jgi:hypothetical protein
VRGGPADDFSRKAGNLIVENGMMILEDDPAIVWLFDEIVL